MCMCLPSNPAAPAQQTSGIRLWACARYWTLCHLSQSWLQQGVCAGLHMNHTAGIMHKQVYESSWAPLHTRSAASQLQ